MKYKFLLFDADNTLFDFDSSEYIALKNTFIKYGFDFDDQIYEEYHLINKSFWEKFERGEITKSSLTRERFLTLLNRRSLQADPDAFNSDYMFFLGGASILFNGATELCRSLSEKADIYIVTNGVEITQMRRFNVSEIKPYIKDIFVSEKIGAQKPDRKYFSAVASLIPNFDADKAIIVGDSLTSDIRGGNNFGIDTCWYNPRNKTNASNVVCTYTASNYGEVYSFLTAE